MAQNTPAQNTKGQSSSAMVTFTVNSQTISMDAGKYALLMDDVHFSDPEASFEENLKKHGVVLTPAQAPILN